MLDIKFIRENVDIVKNAIKVKGVSCDLDALLKLDEKIIANKTEVQGYQEKVNALSKQIPVASDDDKKKMVEESKNYGDKIKALEKEIEPDLKKYNALLMSVPQIPDPSVPVGADDSENVVIKTNGEITKFDFQPRDQMELTELNDWVDFDHIAKVSGARIYALKGELARLEVALHMYVLDKLAKKGFRQISCPSLCKIDALFQAGHFVGDDPSVMDNDVYINVIDSGNGNRIGTKRQNVNSRFVVRFFKSDTLELDGFASSRLPVTFSYQKYTEDYYIWGYDQNDTNVDAVMSSFICEGLASGLQHVGDSAVVKLIVPFKVGPSSFQSSGEPLYFPKVRYTFEQ